MVDGLAQELERFRSRVYDGDSSLSAVSDWVLLDGNRLIVGGIIGLSVFVDLFVLQRAGVISFRNASGITRLSTGIVAGEFSLLTIVLSINQLILSQETGTTGEIRERLDGMMAFRRRFERTVGVDTTPSEPVEMLRALTEATLETVDRLDAAGSREPDAAVADPIATYCAATGENLDRLRDALSDSSPGAFNALSAAIIGNYGWQAHLARRILQERGASLSAESRDALESIVELMEVFSVARAHFKTIYVRRELGSASRYFLVIGIPGLLCGVVLNTIYGANTVIPDSALPTAAMLLITVSCLPAALLASYILRTATVARRTANIGPMALQKGARTEEP